MKKFNNNKKIIINENERGFLFKNGKFIKMLECGKYFNILGNFIEVVNIDEPVFSKYCNLNTLCKDKNFNSQTVTIEIKDEEIALHFVNGKYLNFLKTGSYTFWNLHNKHTFKIINVSNPEVNENIPKYILDKLPNNLLTKIELNEYQKAFLYYKNKFVKLLNSGIHYFWNNDKNITFEIVDINVGIYSNSCSLDIILNNDEVSKQSTTVEIKDEEIALHFINGNFYKSLKTGKYAFWNTYDKHDFNIINISKPEVDTNIPKYILDQLPNNILTKIELNEYQKAFLFFDNKFVKLLNSGTHYFWNSITKIDFETVDINFPVSSRLCDIDVLLKNEDISSQTTTIEVSDEQLALHFINGNFSNCLKGGNYTFWTTYNSHKFDIIDISKPEVNENIPKYIFDKISSTLYTKIEVQEYEKACLYFNNQFIKLLEKGTYYFWNNNIKVYAHIIDTRLTQLNVTGQEILTQDKVSLRINFVCNYKITDYIKVFSEIDDYKEQIHIYIQLALRDFIGKYRIDEILENKEQISNYVFEKLKEKEETLYVKFEDAGVKDIILPGEIREIMNTVLLAEKKAQANVITRREEVASTRSLLNTAKLMEENKILYKLKELEYIERICENVGNINLTGGGDLLTQLTNIIRNNQD